MNKVVSEDALRRALQHMGEKASAAWLRPSLMHSVREVLEQPYLLRLRQTRTCSAWRRSSSPRSAA